MSQNDLVVETERRTIDAVRTMLGVGGLVALAIGIIILVNPERSGELLMKLVSAMVAVYALVTGVIYLGSALFTRSMKGWPRVGNSLLGLLYIVAGAILVVNLGATAVVLASFLSILIGIMWIFEGVIAFSTLKTAGNKTLTVIYAIISVIAGLVLIFSPWLGALTLWVLIGISLVVMGAVQVVRAFSIKSLDA